jgi:hypothetical protein
MAQTLITINLLQLRFFGDFGRLAMEAGGRRAAETNGGRRYGVQLPQVGEDGAVPCDGIEVRDQLQRRGKGRPRHQARKRQSPDDAIRTRHRPALHNQQPIPPAKLACHRAHYETRRA